MTGFYISIISPVTKQVRKKSGLTSDGTGVSGKEDGTVSAVNKAQVHRREVIVPYQKYTPVVFSTKAFREDDGSLS